MRPAHSFAVFLFVLCLVCLSDMPSAGLVFADEASGSGTGPDSPPPNPGTKEEPAPEKPEASAGDSEELRTADTEGAEAADFAEQEEESPVIADPFAPSNKGMFDFNDRFYFGVLKPVAVAYHRIPEEFRVVFSNVYDNLRAPSRIINNLLQFRLKGAGNELLRFVLNSFVGVAGIGDAARDSFGIHKQEADFGQTLGHYGIGHGFYIVWPLLGPSSLRDTFGLVGDRLMYPLSYISQNDLSFGVAAGIAAHETVNEASFTLGDYESFKEAAIDPYIAMRDAFVQHRKKDIEESMRR